MRRRWQCARCARTLRARIEVTLLFHECHPPGGYRRVPAESTGSTIEEMRSAIWRDAFERALGGGDVMLRRL